MAEDKPKYDFNFICLSLGLIPVIDGEAAIAPGAVVEIHRHKLDDLWIISLHGGGEYELSHTQMAELEKTITQRTIDSKILQRVAMKEQMQAQYELSQELQGSVQRAAGVIVQDSKRMH